MPEYYDYKVISNYSIDYEDFKKGINIYLTEGYTLIGGVSFNIFKGTIYYAQAIAKIKEQPCQQQLTLS